MSFREKVLGLYAVAFLLAVVKGVPPIEPRRYLNSAEVSVVCSGRGATVLPSTLRVLLGLGLTGFTPGSGFAGERTILALYP